MKSLPINIYLGLWKNFVLASRDQIMLKAPDRGGKSLRFRFWKEEISQEALSGGIGKVSSAVVLV